MTLRTMLDIETMSTHISNAVVLSVGAVPWSQNKTGVIFHPSRLWVLSLRDQLARGRTVMDGTVKWWQSQNDAAKKHWRYPESRPVEIEVFAREFGQWWGVDDREAWANGIVFDLGNLSSLLGVAPWKYNSAADARTIYKHTAQLRTRPSESYGAAHDPVVDCKEQIWGVWEHWPEDDLANAGSGGAT